jgi:hypothetical protein
VLDLATYACRHDLLYLLVKHLPLLDFEARKDAVVVFSATMRIKDSSDQSPGCNYVREHPWIVDRLFHGCAGSRGAMPRDPRWARAGEPLTALGLLRAHSQVRGARHRVKLRHDAAGLPAGRGAGAVRPRGP